jgi:hypothetical protein
MKNIILILIAFVGVYLGDGLAQGTAPESLKKQMKQLEFMSGRWKGEASIRQRDGTTMILNQEEIIQFKLDDTVLMIEGIGRTTTDNQIAFNALALISYDLKTNLYQMKSFVKDGSQTDAYFKVLNDHEYEWGFETPTKARLRYSITLNQAEQTWKETGEYSSDGTNWYPFITMNLRKIE